MVNKLNLLLTGLGLGILSFSCEEYAPEEVTSDRIVQVNNALHSPIIFEETFEGPIPFYQAHNTEFSASHSFAIVNELFFQGTRSGRFKLKAIDPMMSEGTRAEVTIVKDSVKTEMWYSFAVLFPSIGYESDSAKEIISQWHQMEDVHLGETPHSPATYLMIQQDRFSMGIGYSKLPVSNGVDPSNEKIYDLGPVTKDTWHEFVFHFIHSIHAGGLVEVWHNGVQKVLHYGGNMYNNVDLPKWKLGVYKWAWNLEDSTNTRRRILYYDNIRVGNATATLADMSPASPVVSEPQKQDSTAGYSFTFVNAEKDTDIVTFTKKAILSFYTLGTKRISLRAETKLTKVGSVKFVLKGAKNYTFIDNKEPYALFGDDGAGNYYYGSQLPPGSYNLKVTPYANRNATGKARPAFSTTFVIKKY